jgi:3-phosphoshikimate 1-carboxyvinyltransferase
VARGARPASLVEIRGPLHPVDTTLDPSASSQFLSSLLLTLPSLRAPSRVRLVGPVVSRPYVAATRAVLRSCSVRVRVVGRTYSVPAPQEFRRAAFEVPGDASSAAYLWAAAGAGDGDVSVEGVPTRWPQADLALLPWLRSMGARVDRRGRFVRVRGRVRRPLDADLTDAPDLLPLMAVLAAIVPGRSRLRGATHAAGKESDRRMEAARLARALGASVRLTSSTLEVRGSAPRRPLRYAGPADHRLVMSAAVGAIAAPGRSVISNAEAVTKSFPTFWPTLARLGVPSEVRP